MPEEIIASDGLRARDNGRWAKQKLAFLDHFGPSALTATELKKQRYYIDLFAGPGRNVTREDRQEEFEGSPIRILQMHASNSATTTFTHAIFVNRDQRDHEALEERINRLIASNKCLLPRERIKTICDDANAVLPLIMAHIHRLAYVFAFADIEAPKQWPWSSVRVLKQTGHRSVDLYMLFPLQMALSRLISYDQTHTERCGKRLTDFFGTEEWRELDAERKTNAQSPQMYRELEKLYLHQLGRYWAHVGSVMDVRMRGNRYLYKMLFASGHNAGQRIAAWARRQAREADDEIRGQFGLFPD